jgi:hypothetical protein
MNEQRRMKRMAKKKGRTSKLPKKAKAPRRTKPIKSLKASKATKKPKASGAPRIKGTPWKTDKWFVSPWNYEPEVMKQFKFPGQGDQDPRHSLRDGGTAGGHRLQPGG